jgi:DNA-directed RNA polymerase subunit RPC12/RpoP
MMPHMMVNFMVTLPNTHQIYSCSYLLLSHVIVWCSSSGEGICDSHETDICWKCDTASTGGHWYRSAICDYCGSSICGSHFDRLAHDNERKLRCLKCTIIRHRLVIDDDDSIDVVEHQPRQY